MRVHLPFVTSRFANVEIIHTVETIPTVTGTLNDAVAAVAAVTAYAAIRVSTVVCYMNGDIGVSTSISRNVANCTRSYIVYVFLKSEEARLFEYYMHQYLGISMH